MSTAKLVSIPDMPDIANRALSEAQATLDWVGMSNVHQPLKVKDGDQTKDVHANTTFDDFRAENAFRFRA